MPFYLEVIEARRRVAALHEAAHLVCAEALGSRPIFGAVHPFGGGVALRDPGPRGSRRTDAATVGAAGLVGERLGGFPGDTVGANEDLQKIVKSGLSRMAVEFAVDRARTILRARWGAVERIAEELVKRSALAPADLKRLMADPECECAGEPGTTAGWRCSHGRPAVQYRGTEGGLRYFAEPLSWPARESVPASKAYQVDRDRYGDPLPRGSFVL